RRAIPLGRRIARNGLGGALFLAGVLMCFGPGQGLLTILLSLGLLDVPGKKRLERILIRRKGIHRPLNEMRTRAGRSPFLIPPPGELR
ncbi:MAG: hypothetical protein AAF191_07290, partial [Verrucomicrobiota bacterium]